MLFCCYISCASATVSVLRAIPMCAIAGGGTGAVRAVPCDAVRLSFQTIYRVT